MQMRMLVAAHKAAEVPADDFYLPVHVGHALNPIDIGFQPDDVGLNISDLNRSYCELTALYWALHNLRSDAVGLSHYRRFFSGSQAGPASSAILSADEAGALLERCGLILPRPRHYVVETIESHYRHGHHASDLTVTREVLERLSPWVVDSWDQVMRGRKLSLYNMFMMSADEFRTYGDWLFSVLELASKQIRNDDRSAYQQRTYGYLGERLLNAYARAHFSRPQIAYRAVVRTEGEASIAKGFAMIRRKFQPSARD